MGGMSRVFSYDTPRDPRMEPHPITKLVHESNRYYSWGMADVASHTTAVNLTTSNIRKQFNFLMEYGWNKNLEAEFSYEYYLYDYLRIFTGVNVENTTRNSLDEVKGIAVAGIRWFTPYMFNVDVRVDNELRTRLSVGRSLMIFPKFSVFGYYEYQIDAGLVNTLEDGQHFKDEIVWSAGAQYMLSKNFSLMASYDNRFGAGAGLSIMF
jgi:predicted porin